MTNVLSPTPHARRAAVRLSAGIVLALTASLGTAAAPAQAAPGSCGRDSGCTAYELIHAGSTYGWWPEAQRHEFKTAQGTKPPKVWRQIGKPELWGSGSLGTGTLVTKTGVDGGNVWSQWRLARSEGRWEVRYRTLSKREAGETQRDGKPITDYKPRLELVPVGAKQQRCTPNSILMAGYDPAQTRKATVGLVSSNANYAATVTPWSQLGDLSTKGKWTGPSNTKKQAWHVWAVELTQSRITWFLDGKVIYKVPRPASMRNTKFIFQAGLLDSNTADVTTAHTASQMDWARYWTLKRTTKNKSKKAALASAPRMAKTKTTTVGPC